MPRPTRLDFKGATHLVHVRGRHGVNIFFDASELIQFPKDGWARAPHVRQFLSCTAAPLAECATTLLGYCVEPNFAGLLVQCHGLPLDRYMQRVCGPFARYWNRAEPRPESMRPFLGRYEAKLVAPDYLPHALRRVHGCVRRRELPLPGLSTAFSSEQAYLGGRAYLPLNQSAIYQALMKKGLKGLRGYREFMGQAETSYIEQLLTSGSPDDARVIGNRAFVIQVRDRSRHPMGPTREQLIEAVAQLLNETPERISSATHAGVLGRSLVAWYGQRAGIANLSTIARWFSVSAATLGRGIRYYRTAAPEHFAWRELPGLDDRSGTESARAGGVDD